MNQQDFTQLLPKWPLCTDDYHHGTYRRPRKEAVEKAFVQPNALGLVRMLTFDLDHEDSWSVPEDRGCPAPTFIAINKENGHAHVGYLLDTPVSFSSGARCGPTNFLIDVERGLRRKLGADMSYGRRLCKNPVHLKWETDWQAGLPYDLNRLNDCLDACDKRRIRREPETLLSRDCTLFAILTEKAPMMTLAIKKAGGTTADLRDKLTALASDLDGACFAECTKKGLLGATALRSIVRSVERFAWRTYTIEKFSAIQRRRIGKRWAGHTPISKTRPWDAIGISRATWYRRIDQEEGLRS